MQTILVIDDDEQIRSYLQVFLEREGYGVRQARDGMEGLESYRKQPADLLVCDLFMERTEGLQTIRQLLKEFPRARIIAMSGGSTRAPGDFLSVAKRLGAVAALAKPLERLLLLRTVQGALDVGSNG